MNTHKAPRHNKLLIKLRDINPTSSQLTSAGFNAVIPRVLKPGVADITTIIEPSTARSATTALSGFLDDTALRTFATGFRLGCGWCGHCGRRCHFDGYCGGCSIVREADNRAARVYANMFKTPINSRKNTLLKPSMSWVNSYPLSGVCSYDC